MFKRTLVAALLLGSPLMAATEDFETFTTQNFPMPAGLSTGGFLFTSISAGSNPNVRIFDSATLSSYVLSCDFSVGGNACEQTLHILFPAATNSFSLDILAFDTLGSTATFEFDTPGGVDIRTYTRVGTETIASASFVGLGGATSVSIFSNDLAGLGYDNISTDPATPQVPLPAPLALLAGGIGALGLTRRRRG
ncbi:hypothetical protein [Meridianimarinicoccus aquatilis]|uniref:VPLPA-CTERM sorting domain-containing protein n=1 Tax=Meridianimarinicoccus aquatilis TaxID=2552766 RepID=A0A4V3BBQ8_9RHOB|nr:hypothetical protein [Fluviibacterium aquatile]QIE42589.1 hypothetical protein G5B39_11995 [Rhodobacteraceae bacterium SC52]TDL87959.1 hypothetical protein E2L05_10155 [Fluviibacterium aquatile]